MYKVSTLALLDQKPLLYIMILLCYWFNFTALTHRFRYVGGVG